MTTPSITFSPPEDARFRWTMFWVEASSFEKQCLWEQWNKQVRWLEPSLVGSIGQIGTLDGRPVVLSVFWAEIEGRLVGFWEPTSEVVDHRMIKEWFAKNCLPPKWDQGTRNARCNAANFHDCVAAIREANQVESMFASS